MLTASALVRSLQPSPPDVFSKNIINPFLLNQIKKGFLVVYREEVCRRTDA